LKRTLILCLLAAVCAAACAHVGTRSDTVVFNSGLREAYGHYEEAMVVPRAALALASGRTVSDCADYLAQGQPSLIGEGVNNRIAAQEYLVCDSIAALRKAEGREGTASGPPADGQALLRRLDLRSFPSSLRPMTDDSHFVLADIAAAAVRLDPHAVTVETDEWMFRIEVVADIADAGSGHREWLLWLSDVAKKGNYRAYDVLVVTDPSAAGLLSAKAMH
jgi:hypothetical protein